MVFWVFVMLKNDDYGWEDGTEYPNIQDPLMHNASLPNGSKSAEICLCPVRFGLTGTTSGNEHEQASGCPFV